MPVLPHWSADSVIIEAPMCLGIYRAPNYRAELNQIERQQLSSMLSGGKPMNRKLPALTMPPEFEIIVIIDLKEAQCLAIFTCATSMTT
jgi:hypothetical protein